MAPAWETNRLIYYNEKEQAWKYGPLEQNYKEFIQFLNKMYEEELFDPEFTAGWNVCYNNFINGKIFACGSWCPLNYQRSLDGQVNTPGNGHITPNTLRQFVPESPYQQENANHQNRDSGIADLLLICDLLSLELTDDIT